MNTYLVTGGAGFIGSHIATRLVEDGHRVRIYDNLSTGKLQNIAHLKDRVEFMHADLTDAAELRRAAAGVDVIFHQGALASVPLSVKHPLGTHEACATGTLNVLEAARVEGVRRVVYAGSSSAYGNDPEMPKRESQRPEVLSPYAAAKLAAELYCQAFSETYGLETVRLRYFNVFGPRQDPKSPYSAVIPLFIDALIHGRRPTIYGDGLQSRDFVYVENVVQANLKAASTPGVSGRVYNVGCGQSLTLLDLMDAICSALECENNPIFAEERAGDIKHSWADISAARNELGYDPQVDVVEGLRRTVEYYARQMESSGCH